MPKHKSVIAKEAMEDIKQQLEKHYYETWDDLISEESGALPGKDADCLKEIWKSPTDAEDFKLKIVNNADEHSIDDLYIVPFCTLVDGGEPIATHNLTQIKHVEYQQAEVNVYKRTDLTKPGYIYYTGDDCNSPILLECK